MVPCYSDTGTGITREDASVRVDCSAKEFYDGSYIPSSRRISAESTTRTLSGSLRLLSRPVLIQTRGLDCRLLLSSAVARSPHLVHQTSVSVNASSCPFPKAGDHPHSSH